MRKLFLIVATFLLILCIGLFGYSAAKLLISEVLASQWEKGRLWGYHQAMNHIDSAIIAQAPTTIDACGKDLDGVTIIVVDNKPQWSIDLTNSHDISVSDFREINIPGPHSIKFDD